MTESIDIRALADFLLARLDEDQSGIEETIRGVSAPSGWLAPFLATISAQQHVAQAAKEYTPELDYGDNGEWALSATLRALATPYRSHSDHLPEWAIEIESHPGILTSAVGV